MWTWVGLALLSFVGAAYSLFLFIYVAHGESIEKGRVVGFVGREYALAVAH